MSFGAVNTAIFFFNFFVWGALTILVSEITVRRLRKLPEFKDKLGLVLASGVGMEIFNVGVALSLPQKFIRRSNQSKLPFLFANLDLLYAHTRRFERVFARMLFWMQTILISHLVVFGFIGHYKLHLF